VPWLGAGVTHAAGEPGGQSAHMPCFRTTWTSPRWRRRVPTGRGCRHRLRLTL